VIARGGRTTGIDALRRSEGVDEITFAKGLREGPEGIFWRGARAKATSRTNAIISTIFRKRGESDERAQQQQKGRRSPEGDISDDCVRKLWKKSGNWVAAARQCPRESVNSGGRRGHESRSVRLHEKRGVRERRFLGRHHKYTFREGYREKSAK